MIGLYELCLLWFSICVMVSIGRERRKENVLKVEGKPSRTFLDSHWISQMNYSRTFLKVGMPSATTDHPKTRMTKDTWLSLTKSNLLTLLHSLASLTLTLSWRRTTTTYKFAVEIHAERTRVPYSIYLQERSSEACYRQLWESKPDRGPARPTTQPYSDGLIYLKNSVKMHYI